MSSLDRHRYAQFVLRLRFVDLGATWHGSPPAVRLSNRSSSTSNRRTRICAIVGRAGVIGHTWGVQRGHWRIVHSSIVLGVLVLIGFGTAFAVDAASVNDTYNDLRSRHVVLQPATSDCFYQRTLNLNPNPRQAPNAPVPNACELGFAYEGHTYSAFITIDEPTELLVDPKNPSVSMMEGKYDGGSINVNGDIVGSSILFGLAVAITAVHQLHLHRRRQARRRAGSNGAANHHHAGQNHPHHPPPR
jgi:hypothetical protein